MTPALVFDADDTLWENNVLFERAVEQVIERLATPDRPPVRVRDRVDEIERDNSRRHGYGLAACEPSGRAWSATRQARTSGRRWRSACTRCTCRTR